MWANWTHLYVNNIAFAKVLLKENHLEVMQSLNWLLKFEKWLFNFNFVIIQKWACPLKVIMIHELKSIANFLFANLPLGVVIEVTKTSLPWFFIGCWLYAISIKNIVICEKWKWSACLNNHNHYMSQFVQKNSFIFDFDIKLPKEVFLLHALMYSSCCLAFSEMFQEVSMI